MSRIRDGHQPPPFVSSVRTTQRSLRARYGSCWRQGKPAAEIARDLGVHEGTLQTRAHRARARADAAGGPGGMERLPLFSATRRRLQASEEVTRVGRGDLHVSDRQKLLHHVFRSGLAWSFVSFSDAAAFTWDGRSLLFPMWTERRPE
ncbi:sigma factor-like helix-turn-helix DNA-binding protein [Streptomyces sp. NPDC127178]|uniref:sigma factor-like helix-turn-helix DNA-binding protein n=1 Tax=unclassified Streptomyces TaxID=2593676 RepID=UPI0036322EB1